ncbi:Rad17 cell cycle checkpoint protein-domain-containing protein [Aspergillus cavernicola]|uniref:Rad17 cell cycle checkpoint protein-domain-containing protein n=1 Tax=Aspergillus cavernicola TaxID=176166 RepID=A0ABR4HWL5_9EURO
MKRDRNARHLKETSVHDPPRSLTDFDAPKRRWPSKKVATTGSPGPATEDTMDDSEDLIEDDYDSYDEIFTQHFTDEGLSQLDGTEAVSASQVRRASPSPAITARNQQRSIKPTNRFLLSSKTKIPSETEPSNPAPPTEENLPWAQRYAPINLEELAVHKRKVRDVEQWLSDALAGRARMNLLVLKGPAGSGKTTTVSLLSDKLNFDILEWKTPSTSEYATKDYVSLGAQFDDFLSRGHNFGSLDLESSDSHMEGKTHTSQRRIILIEEFPALSGRNFSTLAAFRLSLLRYISMNASLAQQESDREPGVPPIVLIVSETFPNSESSFDNLTVHRLLGRNMYNHPSTAIIEFNSIAPTFMSKALNLVLKKRARHSSNEAPGPSIIESISKIGDIRNAIASLEFVYLSSGNQASWSNPGLKTRNSIRTRKKIPMASKEVPKEIAQREASLSLFHAVGKIVYNKRDDIPQTEQLRLPSPPNHLCDHDRPGVSHVRVNELLDETGTDTQSFISALHENYVPSCNGLSFTECLDGCTGALSDSDVLSSTQQGHSNPQAGLGTGFVKPGAGVDLLRQEEISYQVAARGLLFALPYPVKRQILSTGNSKRTKNDYKLSFPPTIRLLRQREEIQALIGSWAEALLGSSIRPTAVPLSNPSHPESIKATYEDGGKDQSAIATVAMVSRDDLIRHQLPYMAMILSDGVESRSLQMITSLSRFGARDTTDPNSQQDQELSWESNPKHESQMSWLGRQAPPVSQAHDERFILSDDDIVDDA